MIHLRSPSTRMSANMTSGLSELQQEAWLDDAPLKNVGRAQPARPVGIVVHLNRAGIQHIPEVHGKPRADCSVPKGLGESDIHLIQGRLESRARLDQVDGGRP